MKDFVKDPGALLDYGINWTRWLGDDLIIDSTWDLDEGIDFIHDTHTDDVTRLWIEGGALNKMYQCRNQIVTDEGRKDIRTIIIRIGFK